MCVQSSFLSFSLLRMFSVLLSASSGPAWSIFTPIVFFIEQTFLACSWLISLCYKDNIKIMDLSQKLLFSTCLQINAKDLWRMINYSDFVYIMFIPSLKCRHSMFHQSYYAYQLFIFSHSSSDYAQLIESPQYSTISTVSYLRLITSLIIYWTNKNNQWILVHFPKIMFTNSPTLLLILTCS